MQLATSNTSLERLDLVNREKAKASCSLTACLQRRAEQVANRSRDEGLSNQLDVNVLFLARHRLLIGC